METSRSALTPRAAARLELGSSRGPNHLIEPIFDFVKTSRHAERVFPPHRLQEAYKTTTLWIPSVRVREAGRRWGRGSVSAQSPGRASGKLGEPVGGAAGSLNDNQLLNCQAWAVPLTLRHPRSKEGSEFFDSGVDGLTADTSSPSQVSSLLWYPGATQPPPSRSESAGALHGNDALRQNIYENFMRELETGSGAERRGASTETEETSSDSLGSLEQLDQLFEKEQGVVRKAGWLLFKPLITLHKDRKLELVPRRKWKQYWVTLKGCTLLFYETYGRSPTEQEPSPRYALLAEDSVVQSVPEHPKKENVFCLSNAYGDVYLFQVRLRLKPFPLPHSHRRCPARARGKGSPVLASSVCRLLFSVPGYNLGGVRDIRRQCDGPRVRQSCVALRASHARRSLERNPLFRHRASRSGFEPSSLVVSGGEAMVGLKEPGRAVPSVCARKEMSPYGLTPRSLFLLYSQATSQTDLENWVTAVHSASASLFAKRHGKEDTVRLLRSQTRGLLQKIDMDSKMKKMAELQLSVVGDPKNRKAIEKQIQQWEQNLEKFNMDLFRVRCYLASLQGGELPNPKSLLATASRPSKVALSRLGIFSVSSFHALVCSRDEATMRRRSLSTSQNMRCKRGLFSSSLKGLDNLTKRGREKRPSVSQIFETNGGGQPSHLPPSSSELDGLANHCSVAPPEGSRWDSSPDTATCVHMPDAQAIAVQIRRDHAVLDVLALACKVGALSRRGHSLHVAHEEAQPLVPHHLYEGHITCVTDSSRRELTVMLRQSISTGGALTRSRRRMFLGFRGGEAGSAREPRVTGAHFACRSPKARQLDPGLHGIRLRRSAGRNVEVTAAGDGELVQDLLYDALEVFPLNVHALRMARPSSDIDFGFAVTGHVDGFGNSRIFVSEVLADGLAFSEGLRPGDEILVLNGKDVAALDLGLMQTFFWEQTLDLTLRRDAAADEPGTPWQDPCPPVPFPNQSQLLEEFLDRHHGTQVSSGETFDQAQKICSPPAAEPPRHSHTTEIVCFWGRDSEPSKVVARG
ncbi:hypothetical protein Z043_104416 [Scleropages formosus]|uniref:PDZ domain-containing protein n=1 Tax=Scleropages formosus TaxID=113540 RepID=A0A0P7VRH5_SCLFO|nr:hypothetical protein Z043_104416 [Scleropages formosus]